MSIPKPPCNKHCPDRRPGCQTRERCKKWGPYEDEMERHRKAVAEAKAREIDFTETRAHYLQTGKIARDLRRKKRRGGS